VFILSGSRDVLIDLGVNPDKLGHAGGRRFVRLRRGTARRPF
jgi:hypothetical protein